MCPTCMNMWQPSQMQGGQGGSRDSGSWNSSDKETSRFSNLYHPYRSFPETVSFHLKGSREKKVQECFDLYAQILCRVRSSPSVFSAQQTVRDVKQMKSSSSESPACRNVPHLSSPSTFLAPRNKTGHNNTWHVAYMAKLAWTWMVRTGIVMQLLTWSGRKVLLNLFTSQQVT